MGKPPEDGICFFPSVSGLKLGFEIRNESVKMHWDLAEGERARQASRHRGSRPQR